jgi:hypothetical protein
MKLGAKVQYWKLPHNFQTLSVSVIQEDMDIDERIILEWILET